MSRDLQPFVYSTWAAIQNHSILPINIESTLYGGTDEPAEAALTGRNTPTVDDDGEVPEVNLGSMHQRLSKGLPKIPLHTRHAISRR